MKAYLPDAGGKDRAKTEDRKWTIARRKNEFVLIVFGSPTEADAEALLKAAEEKLPVRTLNPDSSDLALSDTERRFIE